MLKFSSIDLSHSQQDSKQKHIGQGTAAGHPHILRLIEYEVLTAEKANNTNLKNNQNLESSKVGNGLNGQSNIDNANQNQNQQQNQINQQGPVPGQQQPITPPTPQLPGNGNPPPLTNSYIDGVALLRLELGTLGNVQQLVFPPNQIINQGRVPGHGAHGHGSLIRVDPQLSLEVIEDLFLQMSKGVAAVHSRGVLHADVKLENFILVSCDGNCNQRNNRYNYQVKIADFGTARILQESDGGPTNNYGPNKGPINESNNNIHDGTDINNDINDSRVKRLRNESDIQPNINNSNTNFNNKQNLLLFEDEKNRILFPRRIGTVPYMAPEIICPRGRKVGRGIDIWSLGICYYKILYRRFPDKHNANTCTELLFAIRERNGKIEFPKDFERWLGYEHFDIYDYNIEDLISEERMKEKMMEIEKEKEKEKERENEIKQIKEKEQEEDRIRKLYMELQKENSNGIMENEGNESRCLKDQLICADETGILGPRHEQTIEVQQQEPLLQGEGEDRDLLERKTTGHIQRNSESNSMSDTRLESSTVSESTDSLPQTWHNTPQHQSASHINNVDHAQNQMQLLNDIENFSHNLNSKLKVTNKHNAIGITPVSFPPPALPQFFHSRYRNLVNISRGCLQPDEPLRWIASEIVMALQDKNVENSKSLLLQKEKDYHCYLNHNNAGDGMGNGLENQYDRNTTYLLDQVRAEVEKAQGQADNHNNESEILLNPENSSELQTLEMEREAIVQQQDSIRTKSEFSNYTVSLSEASCTNRNLNQSQTVTVNEQTQNGNLVTITVSEPDNDHNHDIDDDQICVVDISDESSDSNTDKNYNTDDDLIHRTRPNKRHSDYDLQSKRGSYVGLSAAKLDSSYHQYVIENSKTINKSNPSKTTLLPSSCLSKISRFIIPTTFRGVVIAFIGVATLSTFVILVATGVIPIFAKVDQDSDRKQPLDKLKDDKESNTDTITVTESQNLTSSPNTLTHTGPGSQGPTGAGPGISTNTNFNVGPSSGYDSGSHSSRSSKSSSSNSSLPGNGAATTKHNDDTSGSDDSKNGTSGPPDSPKGGAGNDGKVRRVAFDDESTGTAEASASSTTNNNTKPAETAQSVKSDASVQTDTNEKRASRSSSRSETPERRSRSRSRNQFKRRSRAKIRRKKRQKY